ncbi:hypothetical protein ACFW04_011652 [Cataglyphis niger]
MITAFIEQDHRDWDLHLTEFRFAYNSAYHTLEPLAIHSRRETQEPELEVEEAATGKWKERMERIQALRDWVVENLETAHQRQSRLLQFAQHVLSSAAHAISAKLAAKYHGPFIVSKILSSVVYELADEENKMIGKTHIKDLKPYIVSNP